MSTTEHTRRTMLAALGAALVPACSSGRDPTGRSLDKPYVPGAEQYATHEEHRIATTCTRCPAACGISVRVVEGRAVRIEGNAAHPAGAGIGVRGLAGLQALYDPDRIAGPLHRVGDRLEPIAWPAALDKLAGELARLRVRAPEKLLVLSGLEHGFTHELLARFARVFGSPNFVDGSPAHSATLARAMELSLGVRALPVHDWAGAGAVLSLESGLFEDACRSTLLARSNRRAPLIHAGSMFDLAAHAADRWLRIRPGTAGALALGICHVLTRDAAPSALKTLAASFTPERVAAITGYRDSVDDLARELWQRRPVVVFVDERSLAFSNGIDTARVALALSKLFGSDVRVPAVAPFAAWSEPVLDDLATRSLTTPRLDGAGSPPFPGARSVLDTLPDAIRRARPDVAMLFHANPLHGRPQRARWRDALAAVPLVVSFSPVLDETVTAVADLVLPDHTYLERFDEASPYPGSRRATAGVCLPVVAPLHDTRATADVVLELARRLGDPIARALPWRTARSAFEERWLGLHAAQRGSIVEATARAFFDRFYAAGFWVDDRESPAPDPTVAVPARWSEPEWDGAVAQYPLALVAYHPLGHGDGGGANQPWLRQLHARPKHGPWSCAASVSPRDLPAGTRDGDRLRVVSPHGSLVLRVAIDPYIVPGTIAIPTGGGHTAGGRWAKGFGVDVMELVGGTARPDTGASAWCTTRVRLERLS